MGPGGHILGMTTPENMVRLGISDTEDLVALAPYLLGYQPSERLVFMVLQRGRLVVTGALSLEAVGEPAEFADAIGQAIEQHSDPLVLFACWSHDEELAQEALSMAELSVGPDRVLDSVAIGEHRWRSRSGHGRGGDVAELENSPAVAQAVVAGLVRAPSREAVVEVVQGPSGELLAQLRELHADARETVLERGPGTTLPRARGLQKTLLEQGRRTPGLLAELSVHAGMPQVRDELWLQITTRNAQRHLDLWSAVVAQSPPEHAEGPLLMMAFASWLSGEGTLLVACLERAHQLGASGWQIDALDQINRHAVNPRTWGQGRAGEVFGAPPPRSARRAARAG